MAKLHFYYSAMNAGKTTTLLQSNHNYNERGMNTMLFKPSFDNRNQTQKIFSRIGLMAQAIQFDRQFNFFTYIDTTMRTQSHKIQCILIDEAQFLTKDQVHQLTQIVDKLNIPVLTYGLRTDFQGEPFEGSQYLLSWAEELTEIKTICYCGRKATMNMRIDQEGKRVSEGNQIEIGGNERYIATCRKHFTMDLPESYFKLRGRAVA